ncbi:MAG: ATP-binding protein [Tissierellia bacterium]|nr:ATP-binding protein [Tissierellia bacterium]
MPISIEKELHLRRVENEEQLKKRQEEVYKKLPQVEKIDQELRRLNFKRIEEALNSRDYSASVSKIKDLKEKKDLVLKAHGYDPSYLELKYHCDICKDRGVVNNKACICRKKLLAEKLYDQSSIKNRIMKENFSTFNPRLFRKSIQEGEDISPYANIIGIRDDLKNLLQKKGKKLPNMYFFGKVGTGKTFMINCIAKELMDQGVPVLYQSSNDMLNFLNSYQFMYPEEKRDNKAKVDLIYDIDVLIIDDLGTEMVTEVTKSNLFEVINKRIISEKTTIISSNIMIYDLGQVYDSRISSRISGEYTPIEFYGNDVRFHGYE